MDNETKAKYFEKLQKVFIAKIDKTNLLTEYNDFLFRPLF